MTLTLLKDNVVTQKAAAAMTRANGAEVNVERIDLSLTGGRIGAANIQVTDPKKPEFNQLSVGSLSADAALYDLSCGKLVINEMQLSEVRFDTERQTPGQVLTRDKGAEEPFDPDAYKVPVEDLGKLEGYFENAKKFKEFIDKIRQYLPKPDDGGKPQPEQIPQTVLEYLRARALTSPTPRVLAKRLVMEKVELPGTPFGTCTIIITNVSDAPAAADLPVKIEIQSEGSPEAFVMTAHFESANKVPAVEGVFNKIDLNSFQSQMSDKNPIVFKSGSTSGSFNGTATTEPPSTSISPLTCKTSRPTAAARACWGWTPKTPPRCSEFSRTSKPSCGSSARLMIPESSSTQRGSVKNFRRPSSMRARNASTRNCRSSSAANSVINCRPRSKKSSKTPPAWSKASATSSAAKKDNK